MSFCQTQSKQKTNHRLWIKVLLTTLLIVNAVIAKSGTTIDQNNTNSLRRDTVSVSTNQLNEVRTNNLYVQTKNIRTRLYTQSDINRNYVDSLYKASITQLSTQLSNTVVEQLQAYNASTKQQHYIEAKAYLLVPSSFFLWLILLLIGNKIENKQLIAVALVLLISSIIGTFIVLPTIINFL